MRRTRLGVDLQHYTGPWGWLGELSVGSDYEQDVVNYLAELDWNNPDEDWQLYVQGRGFNQRFTSGWVDDHSASLGVRHTPDNRWALSAQLTRGLANFADAEDDTILALQVRYRL